MDEIDEVDYCICESCKLIFDNDNDYDSHNCVGSVHPNYTIPTSTNGYKCPLCDNIYATQNILGEHFYLEHGTYDSMQTLDNNIIRNGFPGFDILDYINMTNYLDSDELNNLLNKGERCCICTDLFVNYTEEYVNTCDNINKNIYDDLDGYVSDSALTNHKRAIIFNNYIDIYNRIYFDISHKYKLDISNNIISITDPRIISAYNYCRYKEHSPIKLSCCNNLICMPCLQYHIMSKNLIICPYCNHDHTVTDMKYIIYFDKSDYKDKNKKNAFL